jgi:predicted acylesterase/phospholipase RssA
MQYDLVFEGGGAKGMVLVGAYQEFAARQHTFNRLLGTSAGAITAALLAAGYNVEEMLAALNERDQGKPVFAGFMGAPKPLDPAELHNSALRAWLREINIPLIPDGLEEKLDDQIVKSLTQNPIFSHLFAFIERGGWYAADRFVTWLQAKLNSGLCKGQPRCFSPMTLAQFFAATGVELTLIASDTSAERMLVLNHNTAPDCPVVWAVRMSMSIPLLWDEVHWQPTWGLYRKRDITGHAIVDGGLLSNFPIELLVSDEPEVTAVMGPKQAHPVLGLLIDETLPVEGAPPGPNEEARWGALRTVQRVMRLVDTATKGHDKMVIEAFEDRVVKLPAQGYGTTEFNMSDARREALVAAGRRAMQEHLDRPQPMADSGASDLESVAQVQRIANRVATRILEQ